MRRRIHISLSVLASVVHTRLSVHRLLSGFYLSVLAVAENTTIDDLLRTSAATLPLLIAPPPFFQMLWAPDANPAMPPAAAASPAAAPAPAAAAPAPAPFSRAGTPFRSLPPASAVSRAVLSIGVAGSKALLRAPAQYVAHCLLMLLVVKPTLPNIIYGLANGFEGARRAREGARGGGGGGQGGRAGGARGGGRAFPCRPTCHRSSPC